MKIASVIGARPNFIKAAPLSRKLRKNFEEILIHTGQHYDYEMNKVFFDQLNIPEPTYHLGVGSGNQGYQTGEMIKKIEDVLLKENPNLVLVYGDTNTTMSGALSAIKLRIKLGHIEAGLRSFDKTMPEEINRVVTDHCSDLLFCPTINAVDNLKKENIFSGVHLTGDVMVDALLYNKRVAEKSKILEMLNLDKNQYIVVTVHRESNTDKEKNLEDIVNAICSVEEDIIFPLHPRTKKNLINYGLYEKLKKKVKVIEPLGYIEFLKLISYAKKILTDSGGIQKEAYMLAVPCITLRENTEWIETVERGWNVLVGTNREKILEMIKEFNPKKRPEEVFGKNVSEKIVNIIQ